VDGELPAQVSILSGTTAGFDIITGGVYISSPAFYAKVNDSVTTTTALGVLIPLYFQVAASVYVANPSYTPVKKNSSGIVLQTAPWTQQTAVISETDKDSIRNGLATESNVNVVKTNTNLIPGLF
jgi:flagellar basal body rod protein FlgG